MDRVVAALEHGVAAGDHLGAQLVVLVDGEVRADIAVGEAAPGRALGGDTLLPWFSVTKVVTAVTVLQQWEAGRLGLDDRVVDHLPDRAGGNGEAVTVRHLLTHTAGLAGGSGPGPLTVRPGWVPGRRAAYQPRASFHLLGELVARLAGRPWADVVHEDVFERLGMADSWVDIPERRAAVYGDRLGAMFDTKRQPPAPVDGTGAGPFHHPAEPSSSGVGPARDLVRVFEALRRGGGIDGERILTRPVVEAMTARHRVGLKDETFGAHIDWGLGIMVDSAHYTGAAAPYGYGRHASWRSAGHGGAESSIAFFDPDARLAVALITNGMAGEPRHHERAQSVLTLLYEELGRA